MEQIPAGVACEDYPDDTVFLFSEKKREGDPETFELLPRKRLPIITPEEAWAVHNAVS